MTRRACRCFVLAALLVIALPQAAHATAGDLYAAGTAYQASTYRNHRSLFGGPELWVVDINANAGDAGRPIHAPEGGSVSIFSTGWGDGYGNSIIWTSADGQEQIHVAHLSAFGATGPVSGGTVIGYAGRTGNSSGDHMHVSRAYAGQAAPLILSGHEIVPGYSGNGSQYSSGGPAPVSFAVSGMVDGMTYYRPVTAEYSCTGADAGTLCATLDGAPIASGAPIATPGTHTLALSASFAGCTYTRSVSFTVAAPPSPAAQPVFRFLRRDNGTHFYTPSDGERDTVAVTWPNVYCYEGLAYWANPATATQPLYRFFNLRNGSHFYTANPTERDTVRANWPTIYRFEGETYPVSPYPMAGATTVYRFFKRDTGSHFYTADPVERDRVIANWPTIYRFEGEAFWLTQ